MERKGAALILSFMLCVPGSAGAAQIRSTGRPSLTPQLALQLITSNLRKPYVGNSIYFNSDGSLYQDLSEAFAGYMIKQGLLTCDKTAEGRIDTSHCRLTPQGRQSPYLGTVRSRNPVNYYLRWADDKNPQLLTRQITNPSAVPFRFTRVKNGFGAKFFGHKTEIIKASGEFVLKNGRWILAGIKGMPGD